MSTRNYGLITSIDQLAQFFERLRETDGPIGWDIETGYLGSDREKFSLHPETAILVGFSFTNSTDWARYVPLRHDSGENLDSRAVARLVWPLAQSGRFVIHNAPFELRHMSRWFRKLLVKDPEYGDAVFASDGYFPFRSCTQVESYLAAEYQSFALKSLVKEIFGHTMTELHELFPDLPVNKRKFLRFNPLDQNDPKVIEYACEDALWTLCLHQHYHDKVKERLLYRVEMGVLDNVCEMEDYGVRYDWALMRRTAEELRVFRDRFNAEIMTKLSEMVGDLVAINLASPKQVGELLYGKLGMKTNVYTVASRDKPPAEKKMSTGKVALAGLAKKHPVVKQILQWKEITRLLGTYLEVYEDKFGYAEDGHTHPNHMSAVVVTGRFAVADPPYQGSPKKYHYDLVEALAVHAVHAEAHGPKCTCDEEQFRPESGTCFKFNFRDAVIAPKDYYILGFDYSQAELRAIAGEAQEIALLRAFESGQDVHRVTAALIFNTSVDQVTAEQRDVGKTITFALQYGMSEQGLADRLGVSFDEAEALYNRYFSAFSSIATWNERQIAQAKASGYVMSKFGRRLPIWEYQSDKHWIRSKGDRAAVNYPIQGCLPSDTRILTRAGWLPIGEFEDGTDVWTGAEWAPAIRLEMGVAPRVRLWLSDGRSFDCDDRHRLLVKSDPWPEWKLVTEAKGLSLCQDQNTDWGESDDSSVEDWYWVGRFVGDGSLYRNNQGWVVWSLAFDGVKEADDVERFKLWLGDRFKGGTNSKVGYHVDDKNLKRGIGKGVSIIGGTKAGVAFWQAHGINVGDKSKTLRIPPRVYRLDRARREAFCEGYLDADGNARYNGTETYWSKLTSASREGLEDMLRLFQTVGRTGLIGNPVTLKGRAAGGADYVFWDLWLHRKQKDLTIVDLEYLEPEPMYTLSVDHPRHSFSSEGLISKNSATGDMSKIAMVRARKALRAAGLADRVHMVMNVHDALNFYVHRSVLPQDVIAVLQPAVVFDIAGWPPMVAEWYIAKKWGSPIEVELGPDGTLLMKGERQAEARPAVEVDEETGEEVVELPEVDPSVVRAALSAESSSVVGAGPSETPRPEQATYAEPGPDGRQVIVTVPDMPDEQSYRRFLDLLLTTPGPNKIILVTPEGDLELDIGTSLTPAETPAVAMVLTGAAVTYAAADVDPQEVVAGLAL